MKENRLLILDIDETLIHTELTPKNSDVDFGADFSMDLNDDYIYHTFRRPYVNEFLKYAFDNFKVGIFTIATYDYVAEIMRNLGYDIKKFYFVFDRELCNTKFNNHTRDRHWVKKLDRVRRALDFPLEKMLIVDDKPETASENYGNLITIKPFIKDKNDTELQKLISYLEKIKDAKNFRSIEKRGWSKN